MTNKEYSKIMKGGLNNMNKISIVLLTMLLLVGTFGFVSAEDNSTENSTVDDYSDLPEVGRIGFFDNLMYRFSLSFTANDEKKINKILGMAERRLAEAEAIAEDDPELAAEIQERYSSLIEEAENILNEIESKATDENSTEEEIAEIARIRNMFEKHEEQTERIYERALDRFQANNASEEKIQRFEGFYERAMERYAVMEEKAITKQESYMKKYKALTNMTDEELEKALSEIEEREGISEAREARSQRTEERQERILDNLEERLENSNMTEEQKEHIMERQTERAEKLSETYRKSWGESSGLNDTEAYVMARERIMNSNMTEEQKEKALEAMEESMNRYQENAREMLERRDETYKDALEKELEARRNVDDDSDDDNSNESMPIASSNNA